MAKTLVTGGTGLIGSHVARALAARGDELKLTLRDDSRLDNVVDLDYEAARCDLLDRRAVRRALRGVERVFHVAGFTSLRASRQRLWRANVETARMVFEESLRAGVARVVFTSSVAAVGPAQRGSTVDETAPFTAGRYAIPYVDAKREAEVEALRFAARGLPVVIVNPAQVFGRGDLYRSSTDLVRRYLRRQIPAYTDGAMNIIDVTDVASGHLAADERGTQGERYILGNRNYTLDRLFADLARISGVAAPAVKLPVDLALAFAAGLERMPGRPAITATEVRAASLWWTVRNTKAKRELKWRPAPHEDTLEATVAWYREREGGALARPGSRQPAHLRAAGEVVRQLRGIGGWVGA